MDDAYQIVNGRKADVIGDIHGCYAELTALLKGLGYEMDGRERKITGTPEDRRLIFLGDFTDRGPDPVKVLKLVMDAVESGMAFSVRGNHDEKLMQKLIKKTPAKEEVMATIEAVTAEGEPFARKVAGFIGRLPYVIVYERNFLIAHAGLKEKFQKLDSSDRKIRGKIKSLALYGDITGEAHPDGRPVRLDWAAEYKGRMTVIYGHTIVDEARWRNNTINIDTGCFDTGILTALRLPEREIVDSRGSRASRPEKPE